MESSFFVFTTRGIIHKYIEEDLTEWNTENGEYFFMENHCPIGAAAAECLGFCDAEDGCKPPFVMVNNKKIQNASIQSLLELVKIELEKLN